MDYLQIQRDEVIHKIKILIIGESGVGKTSILNRFCRGLFQYTSTSTIGIQIANRQFFAPLNTNSQKFMINIWDISGVNNEMLKNPLFFKHVLGVIYVYDVTKQQTLKALQQRKVLVNCNTNVKIINSLLIGNKTDLKEFKQVDTQMGKKWATRNNIHQFFQTSALENIQIQPAFVKLISNIIKLMNQKKDKLILNPASLPRDNRHRGCC